MDRESSHLEATTLRAGAAASMGGTVAKGPEAVNAARPAVLSRPNMEIERLDVGQILRFARSGGTGSANCDAG